MYNQGLGLRTRSRSLRQKEDSDSTPSVVFGQPLQVMVRPMLSDRRPVCNIGVYCGQTVGCIRMPFDTEAGLGPGDIVLEGDPAALPTEWGTAGLPTFRPMFIVPKRSPISTTAELLYERSRDQ